LLRYQGPACSFERANTCIIVESQDQKIALRPGFLQIAYVSKVEEIETAIGKDGTFASLLPAFDLSGELLADQYLALSIM
jgi:hypothetical protein